MNRAWLAIVILLTVCVQGCGKDSNSESSARRRYAAARWQSLLKDHSENGLARIRCQNKDLGPPADASTLVAGTTHESTNFHGVSCPGIVLDEGLDRLFNRANLTDANLQGAKIHGGDAAFMCCCLANANLSDAEVRMGGSAFQFATLDGANLKNTVLAGGASAFQCASFDRADLTGAQLSGSFQLASFADANLQGAVLTGSFQGSRFDGGDLTGARVSCSGADFQVVSISGCQFAGADLSQIDATSLSSCSFSDSSPPTYDAKTRLPKGFDPTEYGWKSVAIQ